jgi:hypothetical protein
MHNKSGTKRSTKRSTKRAHTRKRSTKRAHTRKRSTKRSTKRAHTWKRSTKRSAKRSRGGNYSIATVGEQEGIAHKGLNKIVVAGPMGVMSGSAYEQFVQDLDQQGAE